MKSWLVPLLAAALLAPGGAVALGMPSVGGPTGIVSVPTAVIAPVNEWQTAATYRSLETVGMYEDVTLWGLQVLKGVADDAELWAAYSRVHDTADTDVWELGGKYELSSDIFHGRGILTDTQVAIGASVGRWIDAFGMYKITDVMTDVDTLKAYAVVTKQLIPAGVTEWEWETPPTTQVIASAGLLYLRVDPDIGDSETLIRPFIGVEIVGSNKLTLALEYRAKDDDLEEDGVFSAVLRRPLGDYATLEVGTTNASPIGLGLDDQDFFIRIGYDIPVETAY